MGELKSYKTPAAFKAALDNRLRDQARRERRPTDRVRTAAVMERFLARVVEVFPATTILKGGLALELRLERARSTKDIDLRMLGPSDSAGHLIAAAATHRLAPDDYLSFSAELDREHPKIQGEGVVYEGSRFRVTPFLAFERYGDAFGVDVSFADVVHGSPDELVGGNAFAFIGVSPVKVRAYPPGSHIAEKLHAYTFPRRSGDENSRVKDLPDIALIAGINGLRADNVLGAIRATFAFRDTHAVPPAVPDAPESWLKKYRELADKEHLVWKELPVVLTAVRAFLDPVLAGNAGVWDANDWVWQAVE